jgi:hypothetical protein
LFQYFHASEKLDGAGKECWRLSSENGNFISKVIYHFHDGNVFACGVFHCACFVSARFAQLFIGIIPFLITLIYYLTRLQPVTYII